MSPGDEGPRASDSSREEAAASTTRTDRGDVANRESGPVYDDSRRRRSQRARDITADFASAATKLDVGELIKDEFFTLFEAVGALEIMDSKMDSGYLKPDEMLEDDFDVSQPLTPQKVIGIMDAMLCSETAWQKGHPLSQTLFTSLYIDRLLWPEPATLEDASFTRGSAPAESNSLVHVVLRSFCLALVKCCDCVHQLITKETYYEEEDFVSNLYNRSLLSKFSIEDVSVLVRNAIDMAEAKSTEPGDPWDAILSRLKLRVSLLQAVATKADEITSEAQSHWEECIGHIKQVQSTHSIGEPVEDSFSVKVQRKLASTVPPRPIVQTSFDEAISFLIHLSENAKEAYYALNCTRTSSSITFLQVFMSQKPQPCVYVRCLLQSVVLRSVKGATRDQLREFCFDDLSELVLPGHLLLDAANRGVEHPQDNRYKIAQKMDGFVEQACDPFLDIIRSLCMNRARTRRMLCNLLVEWDNVQLDLEDVDNEIQSCTGETPLWGEAYELPLSSWAYYYKLRQMQWIVQLGFELNIYHVDEWAGMYRYLQDIANDRHKHIGRIFGFLDHRFRTSGKLERAKSEALQHSMTFLAAAGEEVEAIALLAGSLASLYKALELLSLLPAAPPRPYSSRDLRSALRLRPFLPLSLPTLPSPDAPFAAMDELAQTIKVPKTYSKHPGARGRALVLLDHADRMGREARKAWDTVSKARAETAACVGCEEQWRRGIKEIMRAAVVAGIAGVRVRKWALDGAKEGEVKVKLDNGVLDDEARGGLAAPWIVPEVVTA